MFEKYIFTDGEFIIPFAIQTNPPENPRKELPGGFNYANPMHVNQQ